MNDDRNLSPPGCECPSCGENNVDYLLIDEFDETVKCQTCGHRYGLPQGNIE
jgi:hypothetical protein